MEPVFYTVRNINGDYAYMVSDTGVGEPGGHVPAAGGHGRGQPVEVGEL